MKEKACIEKRLSPSELEIQEDATALASATSLAAYNPVRAVR